MALRLRTRASIVCRPRVAATSSRQTATSIPLCFGRHFSASSSSDPSRRLAGKRAVVTGSTSGIGLGIAQSLGEQGCNVMINGFGLDDPKTFVQQLSDRYRTKFEFNAADVTKSKEVESMIAEAASKFRGVDILVNNAGIQFVSPVEAFPLDKWHAIIGTNLNSVFYATKAVLPLMRQQKWGRIINISSVHGLVASAHKSAYVAAKHGVVGFSKSVALETAGSGVTCNCINPGWVRTPLVEKQIEAKAKEKNISIEKAAEELLAEKQPSKQFVTVQNIADVVQFLCSEGAAQITGISIPVDGGWTSQ